MEKWSDAVESAVRRQAARSSDGSFSRQDLIDAELPKIVADTGSQGATPDYTLSRGLQHCEIAASSSFSTIRGHIDWSVDHSGRVE